MLTGHTQLFSERPLCQRVQNEDRHLRAKRALPEAWNEIKITHTHFLGLSTRPVVESIKKKGGVWEKENTELLLAFLTSRPRSKAALSAVWSSNTKLFIATMIS